MTNEPNTRKEWHIAAEQARRAYYQPIPGTFAEMAQVSISGYCTTARYQEIYIRYTEAKQLKDAGHADAASFRLMGWPVATALELAGDTAKMTVDVEA